MEPDVYNQVFTMHGTVMMFLFAVPMMEAGGLPDPEDDRRPRPGIPAAVALGYYCYLFGGLILLSSIFSTSRRRPAGSCTRRCPVQRIRRGELGFLAARHHLRGDIRGVGGVELVVSILRTRTNGMALHKMPLYAWYILVMAMMIVVGFPPLILGSILLERERAAGMPFFDVAGR